MALSSTLPRCRCRPLSDDVVHSPSSELASESILDSEEPKMSAGSASEIAKGQVDLLDFIQWSGVECLNQRSSHSLPNALKQRYREDEGLNLESDADEQLLIYIPFNQVIKLFICYQRPGEEGTSSKK